MDMLLGTEFTWNKFLKEFRAKFYLVLVQRLKKKEFMELRMGGSMTVLQIVSEFTELSRLVLEFMSSKRLKTRRCKEGLALYIRNQLAGQPMSTHQGLYQRAAEMDK